MKKKIRYFALIFFILLFLISGFMLLRDLTTAKKEKDANRQLAEQVKAIRTARQSSKAPTAAPDKEPEEIPDSTLPEATSAQGTKSTIGQGQKATSMELDAAITPEPIFPKYADSGLLYQYDALWQMNNDLAGWLFIEDIEADYPVMYTPNNLEYYLHKGFDKSYAKSGCLFIGTGWSPDGNYTIIYGHHMKNGTMFGKLDRYISEKYAQEHPVIYFDTLTEEGEYEVVAAFYSRVYNQYEEGVFRYYQYTDLSSQEVFEEYLSEVRKAAIYDTGVDVQYGDKILALSTCSYHTDNGRFVVVARRRVEAEEDENAEGNEEN